LDELDFCLDNYLPPQTEDEEDMPTDKQTLDLHNRVAKIEGSLLTIKGLVGALIVLLVPAIWGAVSFGVNIAQRIAHIEGEKGDPLGATLRGIESPSSRPELDANLALLTGQIRVDQVNGKKPKPENIEKISAAVQAASIRNPDDPEVWRAAMQLVGYKFNSSSGSPSIILPDCLDNAEKHNGDLLFDKQGNTIDTLPSGTFKEPIFVRYNVHNCNLSLDYSGDFYATWVGQNLQEIRREHPSVRAILLTATGAHVSYSGGPLLPFSRIDFMNCTFDIKSSENPPNKNGRSITTQLLAASPTGGGIEFPTGS
jgi:hypothetical protein